MRQTLGAISKTGILFVVLIVPSLACNISRNPDVKLGVPYRAQAPSSFDCGPASVLMWRLYDGLSEISQQTIANFMGGASCGVTSEAIRDAVNHFTYTHDAFRDLVGDVEYEGFFSRQITSIDSRVPVIAIIDGGLHAGVVNGGKWHETSGGGYQWDYVYFHDPLTRANDYYSADFWTDTNCPPGSTCEQIASFDAAGAWAYNLTTYGDDVVLGGGGGGHGGGPPAY